MSFDLELVDGDLVLKTDGTLKTVTDTPKLRQDILKIIMTSLGENKFHLWYGSGVSNAIGKSYPENLLALEIETSIRQSLEKLQKLQVTQASLQSVSLAETILKVDSVDVERSSTDPRQINIIVKLITKRLTLIEEVFTVIS